MVTKVDVWIGKTLFVPIIIKFCQLTRQSQFAASRLFWFVAALDGFYHADNVLSSIMYGGLSLVMMFMAVRHADMPNRSMMWFRMLALAMLAMDVVAGLTTGRWAGTEFWVLVLLAEYAATIQTIPPLRNRKQSGAAARAR